MMILLPLLSRLCADLHFFTLDNSLLYMDAPLKPAIYLRVTALVSLNLVFMQIRKISPIASGLIISVSMCMCLGMCYFRTSMSYLGENKKCEKKIKFTDFDICNRMAILRKLQS